jgi:hypothetical protein
MVAYVFDLSYPSMESSICPFIYKGKSIDEETNDMQHTAKSYIFKILKRNTL